MLAFSVVIPTYNYARFIAEAIRSVLEQTLPPEEIIVADDGSTDNTAEIVAAFPTVRYIRYDHRGVYSVRQSLLDEIKTPWFFNLDADDTLPPTFFEAMSSALEKNPNAAVIYPALRCFGLYDKLFPAPEFDINIFRSHDFIPMSSLIRSDVARAIGFDPAFNDSCGDYDFFLRIAKAGYLAAPQNEVPMNYRIHKSSFTSQSEAVAEKKLEHMIRIMEKHADFFSAEDVAQNKAKYTPEAHERHEIIKLYWAGRPFSAARRLFSAALRNPRILMIPRGRDWGFVLGIKRRGK